jgi:peptidoglycan biosynthesis protein MviN/MurJ (putative lipid II flippase)
MGQSIAARILYGIGKLKWFARVAMAEAGVNLVLSILLAWPLGIEGVALGTSLPNLISNVLVIGYVCRLLGVKGRDYVRTALLGPHALGLLLGGGWMVAVAWLPIETWSAFLITGFAGTAMYFLGAALIEFGPKRFPTAAPFTGHPSRGTEIPRLSQRAKRPLPAEQVRAAG